MGGFYIVGIFFKGKVVYMIQDFFEMLIHTGEYYILVVIWYMICCGYSKPYVLPVSHSKNG